MRAGGPGAIHLLRRRSRPFARRLLHGGLVPGQHPLGLELAGGNAPTARTRRADGPSPGSIRRSAESDPELLSLEEASARVRDLGFRVVSAEDISDLDLEYGWCFAKQKLREHDRHYTELMGEAWVRQAYAELDIEIEAWRSGREGNGRIVAVKE